MRVSSRCCRSPAARARPPPQPIATRIGGFGGADGLARWLDHERMDAVVDATHPYAVNISANAVAATRALGLPLGSIVREAWKPVEGDDWKVVANAASAASALGEKPRRVLLTVGRLELSRLRSGPAARLHRPHHRSGRRHRSAAPHHVHRRAPAVRASKPSTPSCSASASTCSSPRTPAAPKPTPRSPPREPSAFPSS